MNKLYITIIIIMAVLLLQYKGLAKCCLLFGYHSLTDDNRTY